MDGMSRALPLIDQLARNAKRQQDAYADLTKALGSGDQSRRDRAQAKIAELHAEYQRLSDALRFSELEARDIATPRARKPNKPLRELALDALDDLGVPAAPALIADLTDSDWRPSVPVALCQPEARRRKRRAAQPRGAPGLDRTRHQRRAADCHPETAHQFDLELGAPDYRLAQHAN